VHERAVGLRLEQELVMANRLRHAWEQGLVLLLGGSFAERRALLDHTLLHAGSSVIAMGALAQELTRASRARPDPNDRDTAGLAQVRSWLSKASSRGLSVELGADSAALARATEKLGRARTTLVLGARNMGAARDGALLAASVQGAGLLVIAHDVGSPASDVLEQQSKSRSVFVSTAADALERLLCEQKLAGVEALRRAP
jgi:3-phosphoglycerate kinase